MNTPCRDQGYFHGDLRIAQGTYTINKRIQIYTRQKSKTNSGDTF